MRKSIQFFFYCLFIQGYCFGQDKGFSLGIFTRFDDYPLFRYNYNPTRELKISMNSLMYGISAGYNLPIGKGCMITPELGYSKIIYKDIRTTDPLFGTSEGRLIEYVPPDPYTPSMSFSTNKYWYNNLFIGVSSQKQFPVSTTTAIQTGLSFYNHISYRQVYNIDAAAPYGGLYKMNKLLYSRASVNWKAGIQQKLKSFTIGLELILPLWDIWMKDAVFFEEENGKGYNKFFKGFGAGVRISRKVK